MIDSIYQTLAEFGYTHPLHRTLTHLPFGLIIGAFLFTLKAMLFRWTHLIQTARHCLVLALIAVVPTTFLGIMDWQHFYGGAMLFPIKMKLALTGLLLILLILAVIFGLLGDSFPKVIFALNFLYVLATIGLGYFGGELVYGTKTSSTGLLEGLAAEGAIVFQQNCSACHFTDSTATRIGPG